MPTRPKRTAPTITKPGRKVAFTPAVAPDAVPTLTATHRAIARALELDCTPDRAHLWVVLEHWMRTVLYPGRAFDRLTGPKFPIAARRTYWVHLNALDQPAYAAAFAAGEVPPCQHP